jgi:hypothetical protein
LNSCHCDWPLLSCLRSNIIWELESNTPYIMTYVYLATFTIFFFILSPPHVQRKQK